MARVLQRVEALVPRRVTGFGGKAKNLAQLARAGFPVPLAFAMSSRVCEEALRLALDEDELPSALLMSGRLDDALLAELRARVCAAPLSGPVASELRDAFEALRRDGAPAVAVRSSSTQEDLELASAAGLHTTRLNVQRYDELVDAVRACWASLLSRPVLTYLQRSGGVPELAVGVVIQEMVPAELAGVLFTANPLTGDASEMVIDASYGLGELVVEGRVAPDTVRVDKDSGAYRDRVLGDKAMRSVCADSAGVRVEPVPDPMRERLCVSDELVARLRELGERVETCFGRPMDVEWATVGEAVYVLQARPITTVLTAPVRSRRRREEPRDRESLVWSNVNIGEALPGVATPLTWSVLSHFSDLGFRRAFASVGCHVPRDAELVGAFRGRIYLNLTEIMEIFSQVPWVRPRTLMAFGGGGAVDLLEARFEPKGSARFVSRLPFTVARLVRSSHDLTAKVEDAERRFVAERGRLAAIDPRLLAPAALSQMLTDVQHLLDEIGATMLTVYGDLLGASVLLRGALRLLAHDDAEALQRDLVTGLYDLDSAAPGLALWHVAEVARRDDAAREAILSCDPSAMSLTRLPDGRTRQALAGFLEVYGHRGAREAEIAAPRWREDPGFLFATLKLHLRDEAPSPTELERRQRDARRRAWAELSRRVPSPLRPPLRKLLEVVSRLTRTRERLRGHVTEVLGLYRVVALDTARRVEAAEPEAGPDAAFFLTVPELHELLRGGGVRVALRVASRRRQYGRDCALPSPPDTFVGYPPPVALPQVATDGTTLVGIGASGGRYTGRARVLERPEDASSFRPGEVIVTTAADVGWSPLFLLAGGVVTDLGGPLSHAAIVLREYGVPAVVNVKRGTEVLQTGTRLRVDGDRGLVEVLGDHEEEDQAVAQDSGPERSSG